jgi:hypothetical protein
MAFNRNLGGKKTSSTAQQIVWGGKSKLKNIARISKIK